MSTLAAAQLSNGAMQFFVVDTSGYYGPAGGLWTTWKISSAADAPWNTPLESVGLPGGVSSAVAAAASSGANGILQLWITDSSGNLWTMSSPGFGQPWGSWQAFFQTSTSYSGQMAAGQLSDGSIQFFVLDVSGNLWTTWQVSGGGWNSPLEQAGLPSQVSSANTVAASSGAGGILQVWITDSNHNMWTMSSPGYGQPWAAWEAFFYSSSTNYYGMAAGPLSNGEIQFFTIDSSGDLWTTWQVPGGWNSPLEQVGLPSDAPSAFDVAASAGAGGILQMWIKGGSSSFAADDVKSLPPPPPMTLWTMWSTAAGQPWQPWQAFFQN